MPPRATVPHLCVCVCTRQRPNMLRKLIDSYTQLNVPNEATVSLEVIENDNAQHCKAIVEQFSANSVHYHHEPRLGIPFARNRSVQAAIDKNADYLAFVDDDEWFTESWLTELWTYASSQPQGTVIQGSVVSVLPEGTPEYFLPFFQRKELETGSELHMCRTNNVLVPVSVFKEHQLKFDESRPFAGGTDSKLFREAKALGVPLIYCAEAVVFENVPLERLSYRWLSKRYFRVGLTMGEHLDIGSQSARVLHTIKKTAAFLKYSLKSTLYLALQKKQKHLKSWLKGCQKLGEGLGPWGVKVDSYRNVQGE